MQDTRKVKMNYLYTFFRNSQYRLNFFTFIDRSHIISDNKRQFFKANIIGLIGSLTSAITSFFLKAPTSDACKSEKVEMVLTLYEALSDREKELFRNRIS